MDNDRDHSVTGNQANEKKPAADDNDDAEALELILFHVSECYVYLLMLKYHVRKCKFDDGNKRNKIPPRKSAASYRADEWNVNKWAWEGVLKVISKGEECIIRLEDKSTGELYARAFLRDGEPHPVEPVIDSSRYFVLRIEESIDGRLRHAFIGIGFRERTEAYDFQAALHDHIQYINKKKTAEEMEQQFQNTSSLNYSLKEGETLVLQIKNKGGSVLRSKSLEKEGSSISLDERDNKREPIICIKPPPRPPAPLSPTVSDQKPWTEWPENAHSVAACDSKGKGEVEEVKEQKAENDDSREDIQDDDFGDFQAAG